MSSVSRDSDIDARRVDAGLEDRAIVFCKYMKF